MSTKDTTTYPKLLGCNLCGTMQRVENREEWTVWANGHHAEHEAQGDALAYAVLPVPTMAPLADLGGGLRVYEPPVSASDDIAEERDRLDALWGEQNHPDGTGAAHYRLQAESYRQRCERNRRKGEGTWLDILLEEVYEASAEADPETLRRELAQVAAVAWAWMDAIDRRAAPTPGVAPSTS